MYEPLMFTDYSPGLEGLRAAVIHRAWADLILLYSGADLGPHEAGPRRYTNVEYLEHYLYAEMPAHAAAMIDRAHELADARRARLAAAFMRQNGRTIDADAIRATIAELENMLHDEADNQ